MDYFACSVCKNEVRKNYEKHKGKCDNCSSQKEMFSCVDCKKRFGIDLEIEKSLCQLCYIKRK